MKAHRLSFLLFLTLLFITLFSTCVRAHIMPLVKDVIIAPPTNDNLDDAIPVDLNSGVFTHIVDGNNGEDATIETDEAVCEFDRSWWYVFTPTETGEFTISTEDVLAIGPDDFQNQVSLGVYTGTAHQLTEVACFNNDQGNGLGESERLLLTSGNTYYLRVAAPEIPDLQDITTTITQTIYTWTGADDDEWSNPANWDLGVVPGNNAIVRVPDEGFSIFLSEETINVGAIQLDGGNLTILDDATLNVVGQNQGVIITNQGRLTSRGGGLLINPTVGPAVSIDDSFMSLEEGSSTDIRETIRMLDGILEVAGTLVVSSTTGNGIDIVDGQLNCQVGAQITINEPAENGVAVGANGSLRVSGQLIVFGASLDGITLAEGSNASVEPGGFFDVENVGNNGVFLEGLNADFFNFGYVGLADANNLLTSGSGTLFNASNGTLQADGTIGSIVEFEEQSNLIAGFGPGCLTFTEPVELIQDTVNIEIDGSIACTEHSQLTFSNAAEITDAQLVLSGDYLPVYGDTFTIIKNEHSTPVIGTFAGLAERDTFRHNGVLMLISYQGGDGKDVVLYGDPYDEPPVNDDLANATVVEGIRVSSTFTATNGINGATIERDENNCGETVSWWYAYTAPASATYLLSVNAFPFAIRPASDNDFTLGVYSGDTHSLTEVLCVNNDNGFADGGETETVVLEEGLTYYIRVGAKPEVQTDEMLFTLVQLPVEWTGTVSSDWNEAGNWSTGQVPGERDLVSINAAPNPAIIPAGVVSLISMAIEDGGGFTLAEDAELNLSGGEKGFDINGGMVTINGNLLAEGHSNLGIEASVPWRVGPNATLEIIGARGITLRDSLICSGTIVMNSGASLDINGDGVLLIEEVGIISIDGAELHGVGANGSSVIIRGELNITNSRTGVFLASGNFSIAASGTMVITNSGLHGIDFNDGVGLEVNNNGQLTITESAFRAIDGGRVVNASTATFNGEDILSGEAIFTSGSRLEPGASPGCLTFGQGSDLSGTTIAFEIDGIAACSDYDQIVFEDDLILTSSILELSGSYTPSLGEAFVLFAGGISPNLMGTLAGLPEGDTLTLNGVAMQISYQGGAGSDIVLTAIHFDDPPVNDDLANAIFLEDAALSVTYPASTGYTGASTETSEMDCDGTVSVWYAYTAPVTADYAVQAVVTGTERTEANNDFSLGIYTGTTHPLTEIVCLNNNILAVDGPSDTITFIAGETYYLRLGLQPLAVHDNLSLSFDQLDVSWTGAINSNWHEAGNWTTGRVPGVGEVVFIGDYSDGIPIAILDTGSVTIAELHLVGDGRFRLNEEGELFISGGKEGLYVHLQNQLTQINGDLRISNQEDNYGLTVISNLTVGASGAIVIDGVGINIRNADLTINGAITCITAPAEGLLLEEGLVSVGSTGALQIDSPTASGLRTFDGDNAIEINGYFSVLNAGVDGIRGGQDDLLVGPSGVLEVRDAGRDGVHNMNVTIHGSISITGSGEDAISGTQDFVVNDGGTLEVEGFVQPVVDFETGSRLAPGSSPGCTFFQEELLFSNAILVIELEGPIACISYDQLVFREFLNISGASLELSGDYVPVVGDVFEIVDPSSDSAPASGTFQGLPNGSTFDFNGALLEITYGTSNTDGGRNILLTTLLGANQANWTGTVDSDWYNPDNWASGDVPTTDDDVLIKAGANPAVLPTGTVTVASLLLLNGGNLTVTEGATLTLGAGTAGLVARSGELTINGNLIVNGQANGNSLLDVPVRIGPNGKLSFEQTSNDVILSASLNCDGELLLSDGPGLSIQEGGQLNVRSTGDCLINNATGRGILHNGTRINVAGKLSVDDSGGDGIHVESFGSFAFEATAEVSFSNSVGHGMSFPNTQDYPITNRGLLTITGSGQNAVNNGVFLNKPGATFRCDGNVNTRWIEEEDFRIEAGNPVGCLTFEDGSNLEATTLAFTLNGTTNCTQYSQIIAPDGLNIDEAILELAGSYLPEIGDAFTLLTGLGTGFINGTFLNLPEGGILEFNGVILQVTYEGGAGEDVIFTAVQNADEAIWSGAVDSDWFDIGNWENGVMPDTNSAVTIPEGITNQPVIGVGEVIAAEIRIEEGNTFTLAEGATLTLDGGELGLLLFGDSITIAGDLTVENQSGGSRGVNLFRGVFTIAESGSVALVNLGFGDFLSATVTVAGNLEVFSSPNNGIDLAADTDFTIEEGGDVHITNAARNGFFANGEIVINGNLTIEGAINNGLLQSSTNDLLIGENGTLTIINNGDVGITRSTEGSIINNGLLILTGNEDGSIGQSMLFNQPGATLRSDGKIQRDIFFAAGSNLFPGASPGCLVFQAAADLSGATINLEIEGATACDDYDQLMLESTGDLSDAILQLSGAYAPALGDVFIIMHNDAATNVMGTFAGLPEGALIEFNDVSLQISYSGGDGNDVALTAVALLPLDLLSFTGQTRNKQNLLTWTTANEEEFSHFTVERSVTGTDWEAIGRVVGDQSGWYQFEDDAQTAFYRLEMADLDGTFAYSQIVFLEHLSGADAGAMKVYPNPSNGRFTVDLAEVSLPSGTEGELRLMDLHGRVVLTHQVTPGQPVLSIARPQPQAGVYLLTMLTQNGHTLTQRIVIR